MLVSLEWLRALCPFDRTAEETVEALTARGLTVDSVAAAGADTVLEVDVPANRPDCLGHRGIAREIAAAFGVPLEPPRPAPATAGEPADAHTRVAVDDPASCPRYTARLVRGVRVGPSPPAVVRRLEACGLRTVNNAVDASNLVLLELGHPVHFFDLALLEESRIVVRRARAGERIVTLDGIERRLESEMLVIADARRPVAVAGVMGGADTEIREVTRDVLIEAAYFAPGSVRSTARRLGLQTDASHRFERGVDPEGVLAAQDLAAALLAELCGGKPAPGVLDVDALPREPRVVVLRPPRIERLVGFRPSPAEVRATLEALELAAEPAEDGSLRVRIPSWRVDLQREVDLIEEVARHLGYERIPSRTGHVPVDAAGGPPPAVLALEERSRELMAHLGFHEGFSYAMVGAGEDDPFVIDAAPAAMPLNNPLAEPMSHLRRSLVPGLVRGADLNLRRGVADVRLFEVGRVFLPRGPGEFPEEPLRLALAWSGAAGPVHWSSPPREVELHDVAGVLEALVGSLRPLQGTTREPGGPRGLHPGQSLSWRLASGERLGWCGSLHPELRAVRDLPQPLFVGEIDLELLAALPEPVARHAALPRLPAVSRDLSLVVPEELPFATLLETVRAVEPPARREVEVVDRYRGKPLGPGEVSLTVRLTLQPLERTLTEPEIEGHRVAVIEALQARGDVRLRG